MLKLFFFITLTVVSLLSIKSIYAETFSNNSDNNNSSNLKIVNGNSSLLLSYRI